MATISYSFHAHAMFIVELRTMGNDMFYSQERQVLAKKSVSQWHFAQVHHELIGAWRDSPE